MSATAIRVLATAPELTIASKTKIETLRPKSTIRKAHEADAVFGPSATTSEIHSAVVAPHLHRAVAGGRSTVVISMGAEQSGKSTTIRSSPDGLAMLTLRDIYASLPTDVESLVCVSAIGCAIVPGPPVREVLVDLLDDGDKPAPPAGLNLREHADGLPHGGARLPHGGGSAAARAVPNGVGCLTKRSLPS